jgi:hypothetical protein
MGDEREPEPHTPEPNTSEGEPGTSTSSCRCPMTVMTTRLRHQTWPRCGKVGHTQQSVGSTIPPHPARAQRSQD